MTSGTDPAAPAGPSEAHDGTGGDPIMSATSLPSPVLPLNLVA
jgi:hypothetical protein